MSKYILVGVLFLVGCSDIRAVSEVDATTKKSVLEQTHNAKIYCLGNVQYWAIRLDRGVGLAVRLNREGKVVVCD